MITLRGTVTAVVSRQSGGDLTSDLQIIECVINNEPEVACTSR